MKKNLFIALPMALALALTACGANTGQETSPTATPEVSATSEAAEPTQAPESAKASPKSKPESKDESNVQTVLTKVKEAPETANDSYDRDLFDHWTSNNGTGCDTRFAVLQTESTVKTKISGCKVISGNWNSVYDGVTVTDPKKLDIDHMVPLKEAWGSGAYAWDAETREAYANDLSYSESLIAVTAASNRSKSDQDLAEWMPTDSSVHCEYVSNWVAVKTRWSLTMDSAEKATVKQVLDGCDGASVDAVEKPSIGKDTSTEKPKTESPKAEAPVKASTGKTDPQFDTCKAAVAAGYGNYVKGDTEYEWYQDRDGDGKVCES